MTIYLTWRIGNTFQKEYRQLKRHILANAIALYSIFFVGFRSRVTWKASNLMCTRSSLLFRESSLLLCWVAATDVGRLLAHLNCNSPGTWPFLLVLESVGIVNFVIIHSFSCLEADEIRFDGSELCILATISLPIIMKWGSDLFKRESVLVILSELELLSLRTGYIYQFISICFYKHFWTHQ